MWPWVSRADPRKRCSFSRVFRLTTPRPTGARTRAFYETSVREPMAALLDELSGEFGPGRIARPYRDVRFRPDKSPYKTAACSASCGRVDGRLDVHHRRPVDCLQGVDFNPKPVARHDASTVQADGVRPIGRTGAEHAGKRLAHVVLGMRAQLVAGRQVGTTISSPGRRSLAPSAACSSKRIHARGAPSRWFGASSRTLRADCTHPIGTRP